MERFILAYSLKMILFFVEQSKLFIKPSFDVLMCWWLFDAFESNASGGFGRVRHLPGNCLSVRWLIQKGVLENRYLLGIFKRKAPGKLVYVRWTKKTTVHMTEPSKRTTLFQNVPRLEKNTYILLTHTTSFQR